MTLRKRLVIGSVLIGAVLVIAAGWQVRLYLVARDSLPQQVTDSMTLDDAGNHLMDALLASLSIDFVLLALAWLGLRRAILYPLEEIREQLNEVTNGSLHTEISIHGPTELVDVAKDAEGMRRALVYQLDQTKAAYEAVEHEAPVSLQLRNALAASHNISPHLEVFGHIDSAVGLSAGDWWDTVRIEGATVLIVADVAGHGPSAAVMGLQMKAVLTAGLNAGFSVPEVLRRVSEDLAGVESLAASAAVITFPDDVSAPIQVVNAGHPDVMIAFQDGFVERISATGPLLIGLGHEWNVREVVCPPQATVVVVSDGLLETQDAQGAEFSIDGVVDIVRSVNPQHEVSAVGQTLLSAARSTSVTWNRDDVTVVVSRRLGS